MEFVKVLLSDKTSLNYLISFLILLGIFLFLFFITQKILKHKSKKNNKEALLKLRRTLQLPGVLLSFSLAVYLPSSLLSHDSVVYENGRHIFSILIVVTISWILIRLISGVKWLVLRGFDTTKSDNLDARKVTTQFQIIEKVFIFLVAIVSVSLILMSFEGIRKIGVSLIASAGVAGIILGFAAQKIIATVLAGIQIAITQPIRIDDVVIVEKEWGWIEEVNLTYVVVRIWDKRRLVLPTTYFIEKPFQNWTRTSADILGTVFLYTDYTVPFDKLREELDRLLENHPLWDKKISILQVTDASEKTVEVRILVSAVDSPTAFDLRVDLREKLIAYLQKYYPESLPKSRVSLTKD